MPGEEIIEAGYEAASNVARDPGLLSQIGSTVYNALSSTPGKASIVAGSVYAMFDGLHAIHAKYCKDDQEVVSELREGRGISEEENKAHRLKETETVGPFSYLARKGLRQDLECSQE